MLHIEEKGRIDHTLHMMIRSDGASFAMYLDDTGSVHSMSVVGIIRAIAEKRSADKEETKQEKSRLFCK